MKFEQGDTFLEEPINIVDGEIYQGVGSHMPSNHQTGSALKPAPGYDGPAFTGKASNGVIRDLRVDGFKNHGIDIQTDSSFIIDNVAALRCEGNGFNFTRQLALRAGTLMAYANNGHGVYCGGQLIHIDMLIGDNNETLLKALGNVQSSISVDAFRSERWDSGEGARQSIIFDLSMRGGCFKIGQGHVHTGGETPKGFAWINVDTHTVLEVGSITTSDLDGYQHGYYCGRTGVIRSPAELARHKVYFGYDFAPATFQH